ncbi:MAG: gamma-glutamyl-gamma-aminobutyrate hydrolase family protein, partial [Bacteroidota bacterium]
RGQERIAVAAVGVHVAGRRALLLGLAEHVRVARIQALDAGLPILGICRGMQVFNVALGGTMIPDVQTAGYQSHRKDLGTGTDRRHAVRIAEGSLLRSVAHGLHGEVNTNHHQAIDRLAPGLRPTAWSPDELVEALEWENPREKPFLQLVQWHPERMADFENPLSKKLVERFVNEVHASIENEYS